MRLFIKVLAICALMVCSLSLAACRSQTPTQAATPTRGVTPGTETPAVGAEDALVVTGYPTPEGSGRSVPTIDTSRAETPTAVDSGPALTVTPTPIPTPTTMPIPTSSVYPAPVTLPTLATTGGYPPPALIYPTSYPAPGTPVDYANAYPGPGTPVATPSPVGLPIVTPSQAPVQGFPTSPASGPTATVVPTDAPGSPLVTPFPSLTAPTQTALAPTPTSTLYIVRTGFYPSDPSTVVLAAGRPQLVELYAVWSTASKSMAPVVNGLDVRYHNRMNFIYLDVDDSATNLFKKALGYQYPPQFFLLDGQGKIINQWSGYVKVEDLEAALQALVGQ